MQTNAPAGSEWVDQYNRAVAYRQVDPLIRGFPSNTADLLTVQVLTPEFDLTTPVNTVLATLFTVPSGYIFLADNLSLLLTAVTQTGVMSGATQPGIRAVTGSIVPGANHLTNEIALYDAGQVVQVAGKYWRPTSVVGTPTGATTGKATAVANDVVTVRVSTALVVGTNGYTVLKGKALLAGWLLRA